MLFDVNSWAEERELRCVGGVFPQRGDGQAVNVRCGERSKEGMHELSIRRQKEGYHNGRENALSQGRVLSQIFGKRSQMNLKEKIFAYLEKAK